MKRLFDILVERKFKGVMICDDIHHQPMLEHFWNQIPLNSRRDISQYGHQTGTGALIFSPNDVDLAIK
jgi:hypothetical protein